MANKRLTEVTDKTLKEIFEEYTEDLMEDEAERFYANLEIIVEDYQNVRG